MAVFRCRMCGGSFKISDSTTKVYECEYCGTRQTLAGADEERSARLYDMSAYFINCQVIVLKIVAGG